MGIDLWDYKIHWLDIFYKDKIGAEKVKKDIVNYGKNQDYNITLSDSTEVVENMKSKYNWIISFIWIPIIIVILFLIFFLFDIATRLKIEESTGLLRNLKYFRFSNYVITNILFIEFIISFFIALVFSGFVYVLVNWYIVSSSFFQTFAISIDFLMPSVVKYFLMILLTSIVWYTYIKLIFMVSEKYKSI
jgi:hypothetical protein